VTPYGWVMEELNDCEEAYFRGFLYVVFYTCFNGGFIMTDTAVYEGVFEIRPLQMI
jgi:hypothetical protein